MRNRVNLQQLLLPLSVAYLPVLAAGVILSYRYQVGAHPGGGPSDVFLRGTPYAPPLFLPAALLVAAVAARRQGLVGGAGSAVAGLVGVAFLLGTTVNLPNDFEAARAANAPIANTVVIAALHALLGIALVSQAIARFRARRGATEGHDTSKVPPRRHPGHPQPVDE
jgi:hypothetical protein